MRNDEKDENSDYDKNRCWEKKEREKNDLKETMNNAWFQQWIYEFWRFPIDIMNSKSTEEFR